MAPMSLLLVVYVAMVLLPLGLAIGLGPASGGNFFSELGRCLALAAIPIICLQPLVTGRVSWIGRSAGKAECLRFHKAMGVAVLVGLLLHPICLAGGGAGLRLLTSWDFPWYVLVGKGALILLTVHVLLAVFRAKTGLGYASWKHIHVAAAGSIIVGGVVHSWFTGDDLKIFALQAYWIALLILTATVWLQGRFKGA
jgi:predicted ferric reductase